MNRMLTTLELKEYIYDKFHKLIEAVGEKEVNMKTNFCIGEANSFEGTYVFTRNGKYHYLFTEKGNIKFNKTSISLDEITYWVLDDEIFSYAMIFARDNRKPNEDFRRQLFSRELKMHSLLGEYYLKRKKKQIEKILRDNPYTDDKK